MYFDPLQHLPENMGDKPFAAIAVDICYSMFFGSPLCQDALARRDSPCQFLELGHGYHKPMEGCDSNNVQLQALKVCI
jgi:hypothetical protein